MVDPVVAVDGESVGTTFVTRWCPFMWFPDKPLDGSCFQLSAALLIRELDFAPNSQAHPSPNIIAYDQYAIILRSCQHKILQSGL
jgi:hypothetical protein